MGAVPAAVAPRRVLMATAIVATVVMGDSMLYNVLPSNVNTFGVSIAMVGVLLSANRWVRLVSNPLSAWLIQRYGAPRPLLLSIIIAIGTTVVLGLAKGLPLLLAARILWGVCFSTLRLTGFLVILEEDHEGRLGRLMGTFNGGIRVGSLVGVLLGGVLFDVLGRASSFLIIASLGLLGIPAFLNLIRNAGHEEPAEGLIPDAQTQIPPRTAGFRQGGWDLLISPVPELDAKHRHRLLSANLTIFSLYLVMSGILVATLGFYLRDRLGEEATVAGLVLGIATINGLLLATRWFADVANPLWGHLGDRFGHDRVPLLAGPVCAAALLVLASNIPIWLAFLWLPLAFVAVAAAGTSLSTLVGDMSPPHRRPQVMSRFATWQDLGYASGPLLAYAVLSFLPFALVYLAGAVFLLIALAIYKIGFSPLSLDRKAAKA